MILPIAAIINKIGRITKASVRLLKIIRITSSVGRNNSFFVSPHTKVKPLEGSCQLIGGMGEPIQ